MERFWGGHVFEAHRLVYHSTLGSRVMRKKKSRFESRVYSRQKNPVRLLSEEETVKVSPGRETLFPGRVTLSGFICRETLAK